jgi:hypothetical protein
VRALPLQLFNNQREHVHFSLARCGLREPDSGEAMDAPANSQLLSIEVNIFPSEVRTLRSALGRRK